jgi:hypothetical protein
LGEPDLQVPGPEPGRRAVGLAFERLQQRLGEVPWPNAALSIENCLPVEELNTMTPVSALARSAAIL